MNIEKLTSLSFNILLSKLVMNELMGKMKYTFLYEANSFALDILQFFLKERSC